MGGKLLKSLFNWHVVISLHWEEIKGYYRIYEFKLISIPWISIKFKKGKR